MDTGRKARVALQPVFYYAAQSMLVALVALAASLLLWGTNHDFGMEYALITTMCSLVVGVMFGLLGLKEHAAAECKRTHAQPDNRTVRSIKDQER